MKILNINSKLLILILKPLKFNNILKSLNILIKRTGIFEHFRNKQMKLEAFEKGNLFQNMYVNLIINMNELIYYTKLTFNQIEEASEGEE